MISLLLTMVLGGGVGFLLRKYRMLILPTAIQWVVCLLLFFLGLELGSDRILLGKIGVLGLSAVAITIGALLGSLLMAAWIYRTFFKRLETDAVLEPAQAGGWGFLKDSAAIFACFFAGLGCGGFGLFTASPATSDIVLGLLYMLLFLVGITIGKDNAIFSSVKRQGYRFFLLPLGTLTGTLAGAALVGWLLPGMRIWDSLAVGSGMGYYSLSSVLLSHSRGAELGSIALMSNIIRELITLFMAPLLVRVFGKLAPIAAGGATTMDVTLPVIIRFSGKEYAALAVFHGAVLDLSVPVLVGFFGML